MKNKSDYIDYELAVTMIIEEDGIDTGDAQGIVEAHIDIVKQNFEAGITAEETGKQILALGEVPQTDAEILSEIETKIRECCTKNMYVHLCARIQTLAGLAYVVNSCIKMMSNDNLKLGTCLATLESQMEGVE